MNVLNKKLIFIIGSGRSGTHLISKIIAKDNRVDAFIEDYRFFMGISNLAAGIENEKNYNYFIKNYSYVFNKCEKQIILEKTHPNIWFVEQLIQAFPDAKFLGIYRNIYSTVSSMLQHPGVLNWYNKLNLNEVNPFLGITEKNKGYFESLPLESKCTFRCLSHIDRIHQLYDKYPNNVFKINYDELYSNSSNIVDFLEMNLELKIELSENDLIPDANIKWIKNLSDNQKDNIGKTIKQWQNF